MKRILVWFRNDLRLHDHEPLFRAAQKADQLIPVYCFDERQFITTEYGFPKTGAFRTKFLLESVADLRQRLHGRGGKLLVHVGKPEDIVPRLAEQYRVNAVYAHKEVTSEEVSVEEALELALWRLKVPVNYFWGHTLYHVDDLPYPVKSLPDSFTEFRKHVERNASVREAFPLPERIATPPDLPEDNLPTFAQLSLTEPRLDERAVMPFVGGETTGLERLREYVWEKELIKTYKQTRNGLTGADYSSKFSCWLANGCLSPRTIYEEIKGYEQKKIKNDSTYWLVFELMWRDFFRFTARKVGNDLFKPGGIRQAKALVQAKVLVEHKEAAFEPWREGMTGIPFVDAGMRELRATGFLSNRVRQNVAGFLVKDLNVFWGMGAAYFESQLIDYDVANNYGNWNYLAGVGNDPREDRYFHVVKQARQYDPNGDYVRLWVPELTQLPAPQIHEPYALSESELLGYGVRLGVEYPSPMVRPKELREKV